MAREFSKGFYKSKAWKLKREQYAKEHHYLCEECLKHGIYNYGEIVHHITELTPYNIEVPEIALGDNNLMLLCRDCHAKVHEQSYKRTPKRYKVGSNGQIVACGE